MSFSIKSSISIALRQNLLPGLMLQAFALIVLLFYFFVPASKPVFIWFGLLKQTYGFGYSLFATGLFGGLIPFLYLFFSEQLDPARNTFGVLCFYTIFWGLKGVDVDFFYHLQGSWFGYANNFQTIATKAAVDQFIYSTFWAAPSVTIPYLWMAHGYNLRACFNALDRQFFCEKIPAIILSNWLVWIPAVAIIYSMPQDLQIPLFNLVLCFWVLLLAVLNKKA